MFNLFYTKIGKNGFWLILLVIFLFQAATFLGTNYPPSKEQLPLIWGSLGLVRIITLIILIFGGIIFVKTFDFLKSNKLTTKFYFLILMTSPFIAGLWFLRPLEVVKFFVTTLILYILVRYKLKKVAGIILIIFIVVFNFYQNFDKANIYSLVNLKSVKLLTQEKFTREDTITQEIYLPLWFRRIAYNQPSILLKGVGKEMLSFWNLEQFFFQEISPIGQKSLVIFFWPLIIPFAIGIYSIFNDGSGGMKRYLAYWVLAGYLNYIFSSSNENYRWVLMVPAIGYVIANGFKLLVNCKWLYVVMVFFWLYGWQAFLFDFSRRSDYWLDNRPLFYKMVYSNLVNTNKGQQVMVSDLAGDAPRYCKYFLKYKCGDNFKFGTFDFSRENPKNGSIYAGFVGEFLGPDFNNRFSSDAELKIRSHGFEKIYSGSVRDSIAYRYGELIFIGKKR